MSKAVIASPVKSRERVRMLDILRGGAMVLVVFYHIVYDLRFIYGLNIPAAITPGQRGFEILHICFLWVLFAVSGICSGYSRDPVKRGAVLYIIGFLITLGTTLFMPSELIVFGVLSCFGACMVITGLIDPLIKKVPWLPRFIAAVVLWIMLRNFHHSGAADLIFTQIQLPPIDSDWLYPIGITGEHFRSADYFPIIPFIFIFLAGNALYEPISQHKLPQWFYNAKCAALEFMGRHSLIIYAVHQPILLIIFGILLGNT